MKTYHVRLSRVLKASAVIEVRAETRGDASVLAFQAKERASFLIEDEDTVVASIELAPGAHTMNSRQGLTR